MKEISERIRKLRTGYRERYSEALARERRRIFDQAMAGEGARIVRLAAALKEFLETAAVDLREEDILAGHGQFLDWTHSNPADYEEIERLKQRGDLTERQKFVLKQTEAGMRMGLYSRCPGGHVIPDYEMLLNTGFDELILRAKRRADMAEGEQLDFYTAVHLTLQGTQHHILRYAEQAETLLADQEKGSEAYRRLFRIKRACSRIAHEPATDFFEAVQLLWMAHEVLTSEQVCGSLSFGRLDQYLYPFYRRSIDEGTMTEPEAAEIIQAFWLKAAGLVKGFQNVTLGGSNREGENQCNELTRICLEAAGMLRTDQPSVALRVGQGMPEEIWETAMEVLQTGIGFPALFYDPCIIPCREKMGASEEEAYRYGIVGCVEPAVPGREYGHTEGFRINWPKILELMLHGGVCPLTGERFRLSEPHDLRGFQCFDEFYGWFRREFSYVEKTGIEYLQLADAQYKDYWPSPYLSALMDGCMETGRDVTAGGTIHNLSAINAAGMANLIDSLTAIREGVFERRWITLPELPEVLRMNFKGQEALREKLRGLPKYGNGIEAVDAVYRKLSDQFIDEVQGCVNPRGGKYQIGFYSVENHVIMGKRTGATPDGRLAGTALANSTSPAQGLETAGPTAVVRSVLHTPMDRLSNGMVLDLKFHPVFFSSKRHRRAVRTLTETYFAHGGQEIQFNVIDQETLRAAQKHPEEYRDLIVRVSGFSAFFVTLDKETQEEIIARAEYQGI